MRLANHAVSRLKAIATRSGKIFASLIENHPDRSTGTKHPAIAATRASETDQTEDLKKFDVPTLIIQGDEDQIVPIADAGLLQKKLIRNAQLKIYEGAPHGLCTTRKQEVNADLLAFIRA
jgi:pimeloyl-ACP methyl ester carboxylesterase